MRHRDLLAAIADLEPIHLDGTFERHTSLHWEELKASAAGGRWGVRRAFEVLYLGRPRDSVLIEAYRHLVPSLSTSGETLTIEESLTLRARTERRQDVGDKHE